MQCVILRKKYLHGFPLILFRLLKKISIKTTELGCRLCINGMACMLPVLGHYILLCCNVAFIYSMCKNIQHTIRHIHFISKSVGF